MRRPRLFLPALIFALGSLGGAARAAWTPSATMLASTATSVEDRFSAVYADGRGSVYAAGFAVLSPFTDISARVIRYDESMNPLASAVMTGDLTGVGAFNNFYAVKVDAAGFVYAAGAVRNAASASDVVIAKFTPGLILVSSTTINGGGNGGDFLNDIALDGAGNLYAAGMLVGATTGGDLWVGRFKTSDLTLQNSVLYNGSANSTDEGFGVALDASGNVYVTGMLTNASARGTDLWVGQFDADLNLKSSVSFDGPGGGNDAGVKIAVAPDSTVYVSGELKTSDEDFWLGRFTGSLALLSSATVNISPGGNDLGRGVTVDGRGNVYAIGIANANLTTLAASFDPKRDIYLARFTPSLRLVSQAVINGPDNDWDEGAQFSLDGKGNLYAVGALSKVIGASLYYLPWMARFTIEGDILSAPTEDVKRVRVYPSPFRPSRGDAVVAIADLPAGADVSLYTFTGETVARFTADEFGGVPWDARNVSGQPVASGVYYGVATGRGGRKTFKVVVER